MNNMKPPQVASPPPVTKSSAKVEPPQLIKQSIKVPPPPPIRPKSESDPQKSSKGPEWGVAVLVILAVLVVVAVVVYFIAKDKQESTPTPTPEEESWRPITPDGISLDKDSLTFKNIGESIQLTETVLPAEVSEKYKKVIWMSDNEAIAKVDSTGLVTAVANGSAVISVYTLNGFPATCSVTVGKFTELTNKTLDEANLASKQDESKPNTKRQLSPEQLNDLLRKVAKSDDSATDKIRSILGNSLRVEGASNISNVQQLITDVSNGSHYKVTKVNTDANGKVISISVNK